MNLGTAGRAGFPTRTLAALIFVATAGTFHSAGVAAQEAVTLTGFMDMNVYRDTRDFTVLTTNVFANLPGGWQYFAFTNHFDGVGADDPGDVTGFYSEQNVRWRIGSSPFDLTTQWILRSGDANDLLRLGARWRVSSTPGLSEALQRLGLSYSVNAHLVQFDFGISDGWDWQVEHAYRWQLWSGSHHAYVQGFVDHNLSLGAQAGVPASRVVTEHQFGVHLVRGFFAVAELRYNQYFPDQRTGVGFGFQYRVPFTMLVR